MRRLSSLTLLCLFLATPALAGDVQYVIPASGVSCSGSAAGAERSVKNAVPVQSVEADAASHTVTATFDTDDVTIAAVLESLEAAGYDPGEPQLVE